MIILVGSVKRFCRAAEPLRYKYSSTIHVTTLQRGLLRTMTVLPISEGGQYVAVLLEKIKVGEGEDTPIVHCNDRLVLSTGTFKQTHKLSEKLFSRMTTRLFKKVRMVFPMKTKDGVSVYTNGR